VANLVNNLYPAHHMIHWRQFGAFLSHASAYVSIRQHTSWVWLVWSYLSSSGATPLPISCMRGRCSRSLTLLVSENESPLMTERQTEWPVFLHNCSSFAWTHFQSGIPLPTRATDNVHVLPHYWARRWCCLRDNSSVMTRAAKVHRTSVMQWRRKSVHRSLKSSTLRGQRSDLCV
jgi:hypothetical protein